MAQVKIQYDLSKLEAIVTSARRLDGQAIIFGQPGPAPMHRGRDGKGSDVTTAFTLGVVEFGHPTGRKKSGRTVSRAKKRRSALSRLLKSFASKVLGRLLKSFRGRKISSKGPKPAITKVPTDKGRERPVIRWVAAARKGDMREGFRVIAKRALRQENPRPAMEALGDRLVAILGERLRAVEGVDTGHTLETLGYRITRRHGGG